MILDQFDQEAISSKTPPIEFIRQFCGFTLENADNARKQKTAIQRYLKYKQKVSNPSQQSYLNETVTKGDGTKTTQRMVMLSESDANDPIRIMQLMGFDPLKWELVSCKTRRNDWDVTMRDNEHASFKSTNHQYKIELSVKPIQAVLSTDYIKQVFEELNPPTIKPIKYKGGDYLFELPMMDVHLNKSADKDITGDDYDLEIAKTLYKETVNDLLSKLKQCNLKVEKILFPIGQDLFHVDNGESETTAGTRVDSDAVWQKMYSAGVDLLIWAVETLRQIAPVDVVYVPGNHDEVLGYCAVYNIWSYYHECDGVTVDLSPAFRKYVRYGTSLIGYSHGKEGKRINDLMSAEVPKDWGETIYHEWHLGDLHHEEAYEIPGLKVRRVSSITARDVWHARKGYKSLRMAQAFVWDKEKGRQFVFDSNITTVQLCK